MYSQEDFYNIFVLIYMSNDPTNRDLGLTLLSSLNQSQLSTFKSSIMDTLLDKVFSNNFLLFNKNKKRSFYDTEDEVQFAKASSEDRTAALRFFKLKSVLGVDKHFPEIIFYNEQLSASEKVAWFKSNQFKIVKLFHDAFAYEKLVSVGFNFLNYEDEYLLLDGSIDDVFIPFLYKHYMSDSNTLGDHIFEMLFPEEDFEIYSPTEEDPNKMRKYVNSMEYLSVCASISKDMGDFVNLTLAADYNYKNL
jgi:hypothetical protein